MKLGWHSVGGNELSKKEQFPPITFCAGLSIQVKDESPSGKMPFIFSESALLLEDEI